MHTLGSSSPSPEQSVGEALRAARLAGDLTLREMARRLNYHSHSVLSEYENGAKMPSETVVQGYEQVLALQAGSLLKILETANIAQHGDAWPKRRAHVRPVAAGIPSTASAAASPWPTIAVVDGADPDQAGCSADAITVHSRRIALVDRRAIVGHIELRFSPSKYAAWGRFMPYPLLQHLAAQADSIDVAIEIVRNSDGSSILYRQAYAHDFQWGDILVADHGLFQARAAVLLANQVLARGETDWCHARSSDALS
jgi:transcriptional regulator with XRE-family HTH domain